ncbi:MAG: ATP-binding protein [Patescibacteria group bacterium]
MASNFNLVAISLVSIAIAILGIVVFVNNRKSITNRIFLLFTLLTIVYATFNFMSNQDGWSSLYILWFLRLTLFFAVWHAFSIFYLFLVFPNEAQKIPPIYKYIFWPITIIAAGLTLTPYVFEGLEHLPSIDQVAKGVQGPAFPVFGFVSLGLVLAALVVLFKKARRAVGLERTQYKLIFFGTVITFSLVLTFNLILPTVYEILVFIPFVPLFFFPFIIFTSYAIIKYRLLDVKVIATELLTFALWVLLLVRLLAARDAYDVVLGSILFTGSLALGILLIRSVLQEVKLRERMEKLAVDLEVANADLKRLDEAKSDFISIASHQLRTPLSIIKGYISMMREGTYGKLETKIHDPLEKVYVSNERLITLVNDLLDLSRMERGRMQFDMKPVHLNEILDPIVTDFQIVAKNKKMKLVWEKDFKTDAMSGDSNKLRQVALNLVDNAFKYTPSGTVVVKLVQEGDAIRFSVTDTGPGLSLEESRKLFQKFVRGKEQKATHTEGLGLGLYVAKLIAEAHGGSIGATSPGKGKGSTFFMLLPLDIEKKN